MHSNIPYYMQCCFVNLPQPGQTQHVCFCFCLVFCPDGRGRRDRTLCSKLCCGVATKSAAVSSRLTTAAAPAGFHTLGLQECQNIPISRSLSIWPADLGKNFFATSPGLIAALKSDGYNSENKVSYHETWWGRVVGRVNHMNCQLSSDAIR